MAHLLACFGKALILLSVLIQFSTSLPALESRSRRHADGLFTSELSKIKNDVAMRSFLRSLLTSKRSVSESYFLNGSQEIDGKLEQACFTWLYQSFQSQSFSDSDALEATQKSYKSLCPAIAHLINSLNDFTSLPKFLP